MTAYGYSLSCEEYGPRELVAQAEQAEAAGFDALWISDQFHPWNDEQGENAFVWDVIGAIAAKTALPITTAVTCPLLRMHPVIVAQAAATAALLTDEHFGLGVGTGQQLSETILGDRWPPYGIRLEMLQESVSIMRRLWTGDVLTHHGRHYTVESARLHSIPQRPPDVFVSAFDERGVEIAGRIGDGYIGTEPDPRPLRTYRGAGGTGPLQGGLRICWGPDEQECRRTADRRWGSSAMPDEAKRDLPVPSQLGRTAEVVTAERVSATPSCGPDPEQHVQSVRAYEQVGYDQVFVAQIGGAGSDFFGFARDELLPRLRQ